jgi:ketopantoate reductase
METELEKLDETCISEELIDICIKIYNARNVTLDSKEIERQLRRIDKLFRDENFN